MKIAIAQINTRVGDFEANGRKILDFTESAKTKGADLVIFPELALCGYPPRDLVEDPHFVKKNEDYTDYLVRSMPENISAIFGAVTMNGDAKPHNSAILTRNNRIEFIQSKMLLPTYDVFDEWRNFAPSKSQECFTLFGETIGITICEDMWNNHKFWHDHLKADPYIVDPVTQLVRKGASLIINISASPYHIGKEKIRRELLRDVAMEHKIPVVWVNSVGGNDHLIFDGNSMAMNHDGMIGATAHSFAEDLILYDSQQEEGDWDFTTSVNDIEHVWKALVLGTRDYVRKCEFKKVVIGLSGGIDSAVTAAIATEALGPENVVGITMPSKVSSEGSVKDSVALAKNLGIELYKIPIAEVKDNLLATIKYGFLWSGTKKAEWHDSSGAWNIGGPEVSQLAEENAQARIRGTILMTYSNSTGALVLSTGNKSELAVGYCTLYGDMCGGLAVISDVPKTMVYELAKFCNLKNGRVMIPADTITKPPSAELAVGQLDSNELPPYETLDLILHQYIEDLRSPEDICRYHSEISKELVLKVIQMIDRNEYKRQQATIGLKVTEKAFGFGRRYPIAKQWLYPKVFKLNTSPKDITAEHAEEAAKA